MRTLISENIEGYQLFLERSNTIVHTNQSEIRFIVETILPDKTIEIRTPLRVMLTQEEVNRLKAAL